MCPPQCFGEYELGNPFGEGVCYLPNADRCVYTERKTSLHDLSNASLVVVCAPPLGFEKISLTFGWRGGGAILRIILIIYMNILRTAIPFRKQM